MTDHQSTQIQETPTSVYRYYDKHGVLLYVGITGRGMARNAEHNKTQEWWPYVTRQEVDHYKSRRAAGNIEKQLIQQHRPPFNVQHNPGHGDVRDAYLTFRNGNVPMGASDLLARAVGTPHRVYLDVVATADDVVTLATGARDEVRVRALSLDSALLDIASSGRRAKLLGLSLEGGRLRAVIRVPDARECGGGELMIRFSSGKGDAGRPTIKRIDLYLPPKGGRNGGRVRNRKREGAA